MSIKRAGFTLIELLVVIAIIAILAAILFPVFVRAKMSGQASVCLSNCKQLGHASLLYADDNNGSCVPTVTETDAGSEAVFLQTFRVWRGLLYKYVRNQGAFRCPSADPTKDVFMWRGSSIVDYNHLIPGLHDVPSSYAINKDTAGNNSPAQGYYSFKLSQYTKPSRIIFMTEVRGGLWNTTHTIMEAAWIKTWAPYNHFGKMTITFIDGHAKTMYLYDTIGSTPSDWMWFDPKVNTGAKPLPGGTYTDIAGYQVTYKQRWPRNYPPKGGM